MQRMRAALIVSIVFLTLPTLLVAQSPGDDIGDALQRSLDRSEFAVKRQAADLQDVSDADWKGFQVHRSTEEWLEILSPEQHTSTRDKVADAPFEGVFVGHQGTGTFHCSCGNPLFHTEHLVAGRHSHPSFHRAVQPAAVVTDVESAWSHENGQVELQCSVCGAHLGHADPGKTPEDPLVFRVNSSALVFQADGATEGEE